MSVISSLQSQFSGGVTGALWLPIPPYLWQDLAKTIPANANGDPVRVMSDASGNGNDVVAPSDGVRPIYRTDGEIHWLELDGSRYMAINSGLGITNLEFSGVFAMEPTNWLGASQRVLGSLASANDRNFAVHKSGSGDVLFARQASIARTANFGPSANPGLSTFSFVKNSSSISTWTGATLGQVTTFSAQSDNNEIPSLQYLFSREDSFEILSADFYGLMLINKALTEQERTSIESDFVTLYSEGSEPGPDPDPDPDPEPSIIAESIWTGHVTTSSVTASAKVSGAAEVKFVVATDSQFTSVVSETSLVTADSFGIVRGAVDGLAAGTAYYLGISDGTQVATFSGEFRTQAVGSHSFTFGTASCANTGSNELIFDTIRNDDLDFFVHTGDMHYADIGTNNVTLFHNAMDQVFGAERQRNLWSSLPTYYMWDDHDYGPNDSHKDSPQRPAAIEFFRNRVPAPVLARSGSSDAVYYSFVRGRVRFVATDLRSERLNKGTFPSLDPQQLMMSQAQLDWFKSELDTASAAGQAVCWVNTIPWIEAVTNGSDAWGGYAAQRQEIAEYITQQGYGNRVFIISGDMHRLAFDDGTSVNNDGSLYVIQSAPLDRGSSSKGGPYLVGPIGASGTISQYSTINVTDMGGDTVAITVDGWRVSRSTGNKELQYTQTFNLQTEAAPQNAIPLTVTGIPDGTYSVDLLPVGGSVEDWFRLSDVAFAGGAANIDTALTNGTELVGVVYTDTDLPTTGAGIYAVVTDGS